MLEKTLLPPATPVDVPAAPPAPTVTVSAVAATENPVADKCPPASPPPEYRDVPPPPAITRYSTSIATTGVNVPLDVNV
jgi:hypothetical protein